MARNLTSDMIAALSSERCNPVLLFEATFDTYQMYLWTGTGDLVWNSKTYAGNGWLREPDSIEENTDLGATSMNITLVGVPPVLISVILSQVTHGSPGSLYLACLDDDGDVIADPYLMFAGKLDIPTIDDQTGGPIIQIAYESKFVDFDRSREFRYTRESQRIFAPADRGFDYVTSVQQWDGQWGHKKQKVKKKGERNTTKKRGGGKRGGSNRK